MTAEIKEPIGILPSAGGGRPITRDRIIAIFRKMLSECETAEDRVASELVGRALYGDDPELLAELFGPDPHEDLMDALRGGVRDRFPEGRAEQPRLSSLPARRVI